MNSRYQQKYRIDSIRLPHWDYRQTGAYFITICTDKRLPYFGCVRYAQMQLSPIGILAEQHWLDVVHHHPDAKLGAYIIMPNHMHGIIFLPEQPAAISSISTLTMSSISPKSGSLSTIIRSYKSAVSRHARLSGFSFTWQSRFYEHVIRNEASCLRISEYILGNSSTWAEDELFCVS